ncbi:energy-coupling factor transporter transmembrane component T family protein [Micrococcus terreus]|uniref:energy-coupling factor transporter transmembrane component T family protein n=1 Tax=Micrococcus terreus TaxID=574650 RepID=UPI0023F6457B|nr:energy-coupling factor transporter transmembrane component T [Micrococcus terreus]
MARKHRDVLTVEWVKLELIRTAYATRGGVFARMDPRVVVVWYLVLAIVPWLTHNITVLALLFLGGVVSVILARVGPLILGLFVIGIGFDILYTTLASLFFGGGWETLAALGLFNLKLGAVSMFSMAAFVSLDPEKLSDALLAFRAPKLLAFGVSYGYRMLPILMEEFVTVFDGHRLRSAPVPRPGILGWRVVVRLATTAVRCFYPIFLNIAVNVRTTIEALETKGFTYGSPDARALRLGTLRVTALDWVVCTTTALGLVGIVAAGQAWPLFR